MIKFGTIGPGIKIAAKNRAMAPTARSIPTIAISCDLIVIPV